jgi:hypothetical protein
MTGSPRRAPGVAPLLAAYTSFGIFWGVWAVVFIDYVHAHHYTFGEQSFNLMALTLSSMATMVVLTPRIAHLLPSVSLPVALGFYGAGIALMPWVSGGWIFLAFAITGMGTGLIDVLVNQVGHGIEVASRRSVLQWIHAAYSLGAVAGAVIAALIMTNGASFRVALVFAAASQVPALLMCALSPAFRSSTPGERATEGMSLEAFRRDPALVATALIVLSAFFVEGSLDVWAVTYLRETLGATILGGALGFAAFGISTALGRMFAARILFGMGYKRTILFSGMGSAVAGVLAVVAPVPWVATLAYLLLGFCLASAGPAAFGTITGNTAEVGVAIAAVTTVGYTGFVLGPPIMGWLADAVGVRATMAVITLSTFGILAGGFLSRGRTTAAEVTGEDPAAG